MKRLLYLAMAAFMVMAVSCKKEDSQQKLSGTSLKDYYGTKWVANADYMYVLSFGDEETPSRLYTASFSREISQQHILLNLTFDEASKGIAFELQNPAEYPSDKVSLDVYYILIPDGENKAKLYVTDAEWRPPYEDGVSFTLQPDFDLSSLIRPL